MQPRVHLKLTLFRSGTHNTRPLRRGPRPVSLPSTIPADLTRNHGMMPTQTPTNDPKRLLSSQSHHYLVTIVIGQLLNNRHPPNPPFGTLPRSYPLALRPVDIKLSIMTREARRSRGEIKTLPSGALRVRVYGGSDRAGAKRERQRQ